MKLIKTTLIALAVVSTSAVGAYARDGVSYQPSTTSDTNTYYTDTYGVVEEGTVVVEETPSVVYVSPRAYVDGQDRAIIRQNAREPK